MPTFTLFGPLLIELNAHNLPSQELDLLPGLGCCRVSSRSSSAPGLALGKANQSWKILVKSFSMFFSQQARFIEHLSQMLSQTISLFFHVNFYLSIARVCHQHPFNAYHFDSFQILFYGDAARPAPTRKCLAPSCLSHCQPDGGKLHRYLINRALSSRWTKSVPFSALYP